MAARTDHRDVRFTFRDSSSTHAPDFLAMATKLGATACLRKPFGPQQLRTAIEACLGEPAARERSADAHDAA